PVGDDLGPADRGGEGEEDARRGREARPGDHPMSALVCVVDGDRCQPHELGEIEPEEKCPGFCDAPACREEISAESSRSEESFCAGHLALDEAGADAEEMAAAANKASMYGVTL